MLAHFLRVSASVFGLFVVPLLGWGDLALAVSTPDLILEAYRGPDKYPVLGVVLKAPEKHHFNLKAPLSAKTSVTQIALEKISLTDREIRFEIENPSISREEQVDVVAYLCDDAKTFCIKKTAQIAVRDSKPKAIAAPSVSASAQPVEKNAEKPVENKPEKPVENKPEKPIEKRAAATPFAAKQDSDGFWNQEEAALSLAKKLKKPLLIDFYGIWCPPCNLYNETVFNTALFKRATKSFVLLKLDADAESSWALKSRFKVGGYPTIVIVTPELEEVDRIVGFVPAKSFAKRLNEIEASLGSLGALTFEGKIAEQQKRYLESLKRAADLKIEQKDFQSAKKWIEDALKVAPQDAEFRLLALHVRSKEDSSLLDSSETNLFLKSMSDDREKISSEALLRYQELLLSNAENKPKRASEWRGWALSAIDTLRARIKKESMMLEGTEYSQADLDAIRYEAIKSSGDPVATSAARAMVIEDYRKMMKLYGVQKSRGLNLELAYYLGADGKVDEATQIYENFIKSYPKEFTYYFAAARHYQEVAKNLKRARECADLALQFSYGDNRLRSMTRLLSIRAEQGESTEGIAQAKQILAQVPKHDGLSIRTGRYVSALEKAIEKAASAAAGKK